MIPYRFENRGRSRRAFVALLLIWGLLLALINTIALSPWIAAPIALFTLPAAWEFLTDPHSQLSLDDHHLTWTSTQTADQVPLSMIKTVRFDTRLDLSVRVTLQLADGRKLRLPHACTPPHRQFETELKSRAITTERHHFSLIG